mgnify:CR=1 FL=1|jgi:hypothetical protein|tara:strand:- start:1421 stop:1726 length:306 start_codon:yes stop_codon:yes gene_type:complete
MTAFIKTEFSGSEYINYGGKFVARFKRGGKASFLSFLTKNFSVEEYFGRLDAGESPLKILESKGYLLPHIKKYLKQNGYEVSKVGFDKYIQEQVALNRAKI